MKQLILITLLSFGFQINAMQVVVPNDACTSKVVKSSSNKNGIVKKTNGEIVTNKETMSLQIDPCNHTVLLELNKKKYDLVLYKTNDSGVIHAATLDGKQIVKISIDHNTQEVETLIENLIFTTYIDAKIEESQFIVVDN